MKCLIKATGWIGDALFALSLPEKLSTELGYTHIDFITYRPQPLQLISNNPYINNVYYNQSPDDSIYDKIFEMPVIEDKSISPTVQFQKSCEIKNTSTEFFVETDKNMDILSNIFHETLDDKKIKVAYQGDWSLRRRLFTEEQYRKGDTETIGDISYIINKLKSDNNLQLLEISPYYKGENDVRGFSIDPSRYSLMASIIKKCDFFIGAEGGMSNLAAALGVVSIITTCHMHRQFGYNGKMSKTDEVQLGPEVLFPGQGHRNLNPYLNDMEVFQEITKFLIK